MTATRKITVELPEQTAREIDAKVASGFSESAEAYVVESLETYLLSQDAGVEAWLRTEAAPTLERIERENTPGIPAEQVLNLLRKRQSARTRAE
jgi:Arc/MetJ-type ribon-helix-helix transcriptional regulator